MISYFDTSFLVSIYIRDANSAKALAQIKRRKEPIPISSLQLTELRNAVRLAEFRGQINAEICRRSLAMLEQDLESGVLAFVPLHWSAALRQAEILSQAYTPRLGTRMIDILHVAAAMLLEARRFYSFDARQRKLAGRAGLTVM